MTPSINQISAISDHISAYSPVVYQQSPLSNEMGNHRENRNTGHYSQQRRVNNGNRNHNNNNRWNNDRNRSSNQHGREWQGRGSSQQYNKMNSQGRISHSQHATQISPRYQQDYQRRVSFSEHRTPEFHPQNTPSQRYDSWRTLSRERPPYRNSPGWGNHQNSQNPLPIINTAELLDCEDEGILTISNGVNAVHLKTDHLYSVSALIPIITTAVQEAVQIAVKNIATWSVPVWTQQPMALACVASDMPHNEITQDKAPSEMVRALESKEETGTNRFSRKPNRSSSSSSSSSRSSSQTPSSTRPTSRSCSPVDQIDPVETKIEAQAPGDLASDYDSEEIHQRCLSLALTKTWHIDDSDNRKRQR